MASTSSSDQHQPYFFLSYARTPPSDPNDREPDRMVIRLYRSLAQEILQHTDLPAGAQVGFMDRDMPAGAEWERHLAAQLAKCRVFVPLYSRRYFRSDACGKEWAAFELRRRAHLNASYVLPEVIVPAFWVPVPTYELPGIARPIQFNELDMGPHYDERGLYGLMNINRLRDHYRSAVTTLARRIITIAEEVNLPPAEPCDFGAMKSAFDRDESRRFQITVIAPTVRTSPPGRDRQYYGASAAEWNPYHPDRSQPIAQVAARIVRDRGFEPEIGSFLDHRTELLSEAPPMCPGIVLVDPYATLMPDCQAALTQLNESGHPWVGLVVPWHSADEQLSHSGDLLRDHLQALLPLKIQQIRLMSREAISGALDLDQIDLALRQVITTVTRPYLRNAQVFPPQVPPARPRRRLYGDDPSGDPLPEENDE
ncbi:TIR-like protein FxsC [Acrocarpospora sp. B8E8]|uniref:TIR-like protein FxsC n=1 Tax=Acrocarpospora sp. B8E8 TaxID=3153572 RepID=UPI00325FDF20